MKLVMVTTSHSHWDGLAGNTAMFSEAVVQHAILDALPEAAVDTIFIKKNPQTRRFEKAWQGIAKNFKRVKQQDKDYIVFDVDDLKEFHCPEVLRTKTVGCYVLTENIETPPEPPKRPMAVLREKPRLVKATGEIPADTTEHVISRVPQLEKLTQVIEKEAPIHLNGRSKHAEAEVISSRPYPQASPAIIEKQEPAAPPEGSGNLLEPAFFSLLTTTKNPSEFEQYCFSLLRLLGIHDIHRPANFVGTDAHGFFKFNTLSVVYTTSLVPAVLQENPLVIDHYLNLLKKDKIRFAHTSYTLKDMQKQVWIVCNTCKEAQLVRTDDGIKLKLVPVQLLISLYRKRLEGEELNMDCLWDTLKNL